MECSSIETPNNLRNWNYIETAGGTKKEMRQPILVGLFDFS